MAQHTVTAPVDPSRPKPRQTSVRSPLLAVAALAAVLATLGACSSSTTGGAGPSPAPSPAPASPPAPAPGPGASGSTPAPSALLDLSHWKLTLPVDASGGSSGVAVDIEAATLSDGYRSRWFDSASDNGVIFSTPAAGATTANADSPRSELREQISPPSDSANWNANGNSQLDARVAVLGVPQSSGRVVVGQIHGYQTDPLLKLIYTRGKTGGYSLIGEYRYSPNGTPTYATYTLADNIPLGQSFSYRINLTNHVLSMSANGGAPSTQTVGLAWFGVDYYFKAGAYPYSAGTAGDESQVEFYALSASHS